MFHHFKGEPRRKRGRSAAEFDSDFNGFKNLSHGCASFSSLGDAPFHAGFAVNYD
jgi:hypothetical protein